MSSEAKKRGGVRIMKLMLGNTRIEFRLDYCSAENQEELEKECLKRMTRIASLAMSAIRKDAS